MKLERILKNQRHTVSMIEPRRPYNGTTETNLQYELCLLSYLDILGMKAILEAAGPNAEQVASLLRTTRWFCDPKLTGSDLLGCNFINFSDLIVRIVPIETASNREEPFGLVFQELFDLAHIQVNLLQRKVLIRGAITLGKIIFKENLLFGPSLVRAYLLESGQAKFPRVIVDAGVLAELKSNTLLRAHDYQQEMGYIRGLIKRDRDGIWFVDYLRYLQGNADDDTEYVTFCVIIVS